MVITREPTTVEQLRGKTIAIPGELTTAFLALQLCLGKARDAFEFHVVPFDQIIEHVKAGHADAGLIIHEGQLTFGSAGLHLVVDLGAWWKGRTGCRCRSAGTASARTSAATRCKT
jgi:1,4-dihydroxy-6-naphthoate synthase